MQYVSAIFLIMTLALSGCSKKEEASAPLSVEKVGDNTIVTFYEESLLRNPQLEDYNVTLVSRTPLEGRNDIEAVVLNVTFVTKQKQRGNQQIKGFVNGKYLMPMVYDSNKKQVHQ